MKYGISADAFTPTISVGRLSKDQRRYLDKEDATDMIVGAVADLAARHYDGKLEADFTSTEGFKVHVTVTPTTRSPEGA